MTTSRPGLSSTGGQGSSPAPLAPVRLVAFDLDGVIYRGKIVLPGARAALEHIAQRGLLIRYVTNNATLHRSAVAARLVDMGLPALEEQVLSSASATAAWLVRRFGVGASVLALGEEGLIRELGEAGLTPSSAVALASSAGTGGGKLGAAAAAAVAAEALHVSAVVVGLCRSVSYEALAASQAAIMAGALFVATNPDATYPAEGHLLPGGGAIVAAVATASGQEPVLIGKPGLGMADALEETTGVPAAATLLIGDRLDTDIEFGLRAGMRTALVLTGVNTREDVEAMGIRPNHILETLHELPPLLDQVAARSSDHDAPRLVSGTEAR
jgi:phosphoglycolate/pyridoxal phosphate phosphatase family enzyme